MTYLNQFHKEAMERTMKKIAEFKKSPMNSKDFADYMRRNLETAKQMELASRWNSLRDNSENVLVDKDGDMYVVDAEIKRL